MVNSKQKGKRGELEFAHFLQAHGFTARRGQQFKGTPDSPDVVCESLADIHFEVKRVEKLSIDKAYEQAVKDAGSTQMPVVVHRRNHKPWLVTFRVDNFLDLIKRSRKYAELK